MPTKCKLVAGNCKLVTGNCKLVPRNCRLVPGNCMLVAVPTKSVYKQQQYTSLQKDIEQTRAPVPAEPELKVGPQPIFVEKVELYQKENAVQHNTNLYELLNGEDSSLIIRRGQLFNMGIRFKKNFDPNVDSVALHFEFGSPPHLTPEGNLVILPITSQSEFSKEEGMWDIRTQRHEGNTISLDVKVPAATPVGVWKMKIYSYVPGNKDIEPTVFEIPQNVYILFNPWCKEDGVFLEGEDARKEYILNNVGKIYYGSPKQPAARRWIYGQFRDSVLPAAMFMLENSTLDFTGRASPILVSRTISKLVNSDDDDKGILVGNWTGNYDDGMDPSTWTGSFDIIDEYFKNGGEQPVKYGQCFVFAGVATTICRALGIPCRTVTNFVSARDKNHNLTIEIYYDEKGDKIKDDKKDKIWNFHVWNDVWMTRPDLPPGYGGWQAIDSTPQETSEGVHQLGPAPLEAVKRGQVGVNYDCPFVFAEVNADIINFKEDKTVEGGWRKTDVKKDEIGELILTKKIGVDDETGATDAENITEQYKQQEGTEEERMAVKNAARYGVEPSAQNEVLDTPKPKVEDVTLDLIEIDKIMIGQPFDVTVKMQNKNGSEKRTVVANLSASTVYYTGVTAENIITQKETFTLQPNKTKVLSITVKPDDYLDKLVDHSMMKIYAMATVQETEQTWVEEDDFTVQKPQLELKCKDTLQAKKKFKLEIRLTNPLNRHLTDCMFTIDGPWKDGPERLRFRDIDPLESVVHTERLIPQQPGTQAIVVNFSSRELNEVQGSKDVEVKPAAEGKKNVKGLKH